MTRWLWLSLGAGMLTLPACEPKDRDLASLLGGDGGAETDESSDETEETATDEAVTESDVEVTESDAEVTNTDTEVTDTGTDVPDASVPVDVETDDGPTQTDVPDETDPPDSSTGETDPDPVETDAGPDSGACTAVSATEMTCDDGIDDDCDDRIDCEDPECSDSPACCVRGDAVETLCDNTKDDDCDGVPDCEDSDCALDLSCLPECVAVLATEGNCADGLDDDCDERIDCADEDCALAAECAPACVESNTVEDDCADEVDDDCDGWVDCADPDCDGTVDCQTACVPVTEVCTDSTDNDCDGYTDCQDSACAPTPACCTPSGNEVCDDGIDNNCDGVIDCPVILGAVPAMPPPGRAAWEGGAAGADSVRLSLGTPALSNFIVQCRSGKPSTVSAQSFVVCNPSEPASLAVAPFDPSQASNPVWNGVVETQVRFAYPNGQVSQPTSYTYYMHNSLAGAQLCPEKATDAAYFAAAEPHLLRDGAPSFADADAHLAAPFVNVNFAPGADSIFEVADGSGDVEYLSLRRRFSMNADRTMILMKRVFWSRRAGSRRCLTAMIRKHDSDAGPESSFDGTRYFRTGCDAVVLNKEGAGVCLVVDTDSAVVLAAPTSSSWKFWNFEVYGLVNWANADNFMWRKLKRVQYDGSFAVFSPKCYTGGVSCAEGDEDMLFLPDRGLFDL